MNYEMHNISSKVESNSWLVVRQDNKSALSLLDQWRMSYKGVEESGLISSNMP